MTRKTASKPKGKLAITNYGIIKQVDLALTKNLIVIGGGNGQGKTTVLRALHTCIVGKRAVEGKASPVRDGEQEGSVFLDLGDLEILRRFNANDQYEVVLKRNGKVETSKVQDRLDTLISKMTFDPSFLWDSKVDEKTRARMFLEAAGVDFSDLESKRAELYAQRTEVGRERDRLNGALNKYPLDFDAPDAPVDVADLSRQFREQCQANDRRGRAFDALYLRKEKIERFRVELSAVRAEIKQLQDRERKILEDGKAYKAETERLAAEAEAMPRHDIAPLEAAMANADRHNESYRAGAQRAEFGEMLRDAEATVATLTLQINACDQEKTKRLQSAKLPLPGLSATEEGLYLDGHPISRASGRDRLTVALSIAFANCDPAFPLVCCDGGEQFDPEWLPHIEKMAEEAGVVVILTRVAKDALCTVIMSNGEVWKPEELDIHTNTLPPVSPTDEEPMDEIPEDSGPTDTEIRREIAEIEADNREREFDEWKEEDMAALDQEEL